MEIKSFEDLECWKQCVDLRKMLRPYINNFPSKEKYLLTSQITRASRSTTTNIAEGFGRYHFQENIQFCRVSRGSLHELIDHLIIAKEENYIDDLDLINLKEQILKCLKILNGYINYLKKAKENIVKEPTDK